MPDFATAREVRSFDKKLSKAELARAIRFSVAAEYEAVQIYEQIVEAIGDQRIIAVINDIIKEEKVHVGQFLDILYEVEPQEKQTYDQGMEENKPLKEKAK